MAEARIQNSLVPLDRSQAMLLLEVGYLWLDLGKPDKAKDVFAGVAALMPRSEIPQIGLGSVELACGRYDKALQAFRAAQRLAPRSGLPRAHAGEALLFLGKHPEALKELKAAFELEPNGDGAKLAQALLDARDAGAFSRTQDKAR